MEQKLSKWGNSLAVRIPQTLAEEAHLTEGDAVDMRIQPDGRILIEPARRRYDLKALCRKITPENMHGETDWGAAEGSEEW